MKGSFLKTITFSILVFFCSGHAIACVVAPAEQRVAVDELISRTDNIILAKAVRAEYRNPEQTGQSNPHDVVHHDFEILKSLKGENQSEFSLIGGLMEHDRRNHFNHHTEPDFWEDVYGRSFNMPDCIIHPTFIVGSVYLVFLDQPYHYKSFELIEKHSDPEDRDKWLAYVEEKVSE